MKRWWQIDPFLFAFRGFGLLGAFGTLFFGGATLSAKPFSLHPENPHYFLFRGKPTVLITSAEHYGAVLNRAFDYREYLKTLEEHGYESEIALRVLREQ